jgi:hypothetical protein
LPDKKGVFRKECKDAWKTKNVYEKPQGSIEDIILVLRAMLLYVALRSGCGPVDDDVKAQVSSAKGTRPLGGIVKFIVSETTFHALWGKILH